MVQRVLLFQQVAKLAAKELEALDGEVLEVEVQVEVLEVLVELVELVLVVLVVLVEVKPKCLRNG